MLRGRKSLSVDSAAISRICIGQTTMVLFEEGKAKRVSDVSPRKLTPETLQGDQSTWRARRLPA